MLSKPAAKQQQGPPRVFPNRATRKGSDKVKMPIKIINLFDVVEDKIFVSNQGDPGANKSTTYELYYMENEQDKPHRIQLFIDWFKIPWGIQLGWTQWTGKGDERVATKKEWERGFQIDIRCPDNLLVFNREKDCFEGSKDEHINKIFNKFYSIQRRLLHLFTTTADGSLESSFLQMQLLGLKDLFVLTKQQTNLRFLSS